MQSSKPTSLANYKYLLFPVFMYWKLSILSITIDMLWVITIQYKETIIIHQGLKIISSHLSKIQHFSTKLFFT